MFRYFFAISLVSILLGCGNDEASPYEAVLRQPAYATITDSINEEPRRDDLYFRRAVMLNKDNHLEPALADFRKAWSIAKNEVYAVGVSNILLEKKSDSAVIFLKEAIKELPNSLFLRISLARSYDALNKTDEALLVCNEILEKEPAQVNALLLKADLLEKKSDTAQVVETLEKAYSLMPFNRELTNRLAYQYAESKNSKSLSLADTLLLRDSLQQFADAFYIKGMYFSNTGSYAKAIQQFNNCIQRDHRYLNAYIEKGKILLDQKKTGDALKTFELANRITPSFPDAWYWIGRCEEILGNKAAAKENFEKAYELDKTFTEAREAAEKLR
ncbi:MAG TPA: tetratricopeptide repeat protein [Chitinophagaceae bacterium]|nr:tetratricopeptide repeat protein [Chitinophagaceae bacterium]